MVTPNVSDNDSRLQENLPITLKKDVLVDLGMEALRANDWRCVNLITTLIREGGLSHA